MALIKKVTRVGNSAGVTIDQAVMNLVGWEIGTEVEFRIDGEQIILSPHRYATNAEATKAGQKVVQVRKKLLERLAQGQVVKG